jgi:mannonate dehydratase
MPVYQLLGGKCRFAVETIGGANGATPEEVADNVLKQMETGYRNFRISVGGRSEEATNTTKAPFQEAGFGLPSDGFIDDQANLKALVKTFEVAIGHDLHERYQPRDVINFCRRIEDFYPVSFLEDPLTPENTSWWKELR